MMNTFLKPFKFFILLLTVTSAFAQKTITVKSPNGKIIFTASTANGHAGYEVSYAGSKLVNRSPLGLTFKDSGYFGSAITLGKASSKIVQARYTLVVGKAKNVSTTYNQTVIPMREQKSGDRKINLEVRVFDDGLAFRYEVPAQAGWTSYELTDENTSFNLTGDPIVKALHFKSNSNSHEGLYKTVPLSKLPDTVLLDLPALAEYPGKIYMAITEANLRDYAGMYLSTKGGVLHSWLSPLPGQQELKVKARLPHHTPWRVLQISDHAGELIESTILTSLNEAPASDFSWLKPGKTSFHWWNGDVVPDTSFVPGVNFETNKYYIDFCARNKIEYHSVIGYGGFAWYANDWPNYGHTGTYSDVTKTTQNLDMQKICDYAKSKGVGIHVWVNWKALYPQLEAAFTQFEKWGIKGMMVDFLDRDDQEMVNIQEEILKRAAAHHLFIQFHGAYKPTGLSRTYPNEVTREGTWNYEQNKWRKTGVTPEHDLDIAFTRLLAGPADYHLGGFRSVSPDQFKTHYIRPLMTGTRCHMLAMYVVMESYLHMVADYPQAYEGQPGFDFLQQVPTTWDETRVLEAEPGQVLTIARRKGNDWYVGTINNSSERTIKLNLAFLPSGNYSAELYRDSDDLNPNHLIKTSQPLSNKSTIEVRLKAGGGQALRIVKL